MRKLLILAFFLPLIAWGQSSLPPCQGEYLVAEWNNCIGTSVFADGKRYTGEFVDNAREGLGILYNMNGTVYRMGKWSKGFLERSLVLDINQFPYNSPHLQNSPSNIGKPNYADSSSSQPNRNASIPQSSGRPCPEAIDVIWHNCVGVRQLNGGVFVGRFNSNDTGDEGVLYGADGRVIAFGKTLRSFSGISSNHMPFGRPDSLGFSENEWRNRYPLPMSELNDAERKRRQALEERLASEARERERIAAIRVAQQQTGDGSPDDQTCRQYGFVVATTPYANCRQQLDMVRRQQEQYETRVAAAEEEARRRRMREFNLRLLQGQPIGEAAMAASGMALPERPRPAQII
ncbi:MAG: hypothetical protein EB116_20540, partial [Betaproteobacteria bacterium]|nr:hypothetical protein [Betaproteobacteria bacterium]